jgi:hypothetical protein
MRDSETIELVLSVTIDAEAWSHEYGVEIEHVRADVTDYCGNAVREHLRGVGVLVEEER